MWPFLQLCLLTVAGCVEEEKFPTAAGYRLTFSVDTLKMDTVIAGRTSVTRSFAVYNRNHDGVSITNVAFANDDPDGFRVNVDGVSVGRELDESIDFRKGDSLTVFVEIRPEESGRDDKVEHRATLVFTLANGVRQSVVLQAWGQDVIWLKGYHVTGPDERLDAQRPYVIEDSLTVDAGATLRLGPGVRLMFGSQALLRVDGRLLCEGTAERPVVLRGDRMDMMFEKQPYDRISNQWQGVVLTASSRGSHLDHTDIHSGAWGVRIEPADDDAQEERLRLENSVIHNVGGHCLEATASKLLVGNSQISNAGGNCVRLLGGDAQFIHCTIAQFYPFDGLRGAALRYANADGCPLLGAMFINCVVTGYSDDEIFGEWESETAAFNYGFQNCLLNTPEIGDDPNVLDNQWDRTGNEVSRAGNFTGFNLDWLIYGFALDPRSLAIGAADASVTERYYPYDRLGRPRLDDGRSDAGCYEHVDE